MNKVIKASVAALFAASTFGAGTVFAQSAMTADDGVTIIRMDSLNTSTDRGQFEELKLIASDPAQVQEAQAEVQSDPALESALLAENVQLNNVVEVETAANGGKIVYIR